MKGIYLKGQNWYIDYRVGGKRMREMVGPSKKLAQEVLRKRKVQIAENKFLDIKRVPMIRFNDFAQSYLEIHSQQNKKSWR